MTGEVFPLTIYEPEGEPLVVVLPREVSEALADWINRCPQEPVLSLRGGKTVIEGEILAKVQGAA